MNQPYSLMVHGGAGEVAGKEETLTSIKKVLAEGEAMLAKGAGALDAVMHCVTLLEDDPYFNAGYGSVLNHDGIVEMDAGIMDGRGMEAGAVAGVTSIKNPVTLARAVMEHSEHVFLIGKGAEAFARTQDVALADPSYFVTDERRAQWKEALKSNKIVLDHTSATDKGLEKKYGTVGAVARDKRGNLAAATSTGGIVNKKFGRVGDTPVIGAGVYAENGMCAISATGYGEQFLRTVISKHIADIVRYKKTGAQQAAAEGIAYLVEKVKGLGGVIVIDADGECGKAYSTHGMIHGYVREGSEAVASLQ